MSTRNLNDEGNVTIISTSVKSEVDTTSDVECFDYHRPLTDDGIPKSEWRNATKEMNSTPNPNRAHRYSADLDKVQRRCSQGRKDKKKETEEDSSMDGVEKNRNTNKRRDDLEIAAIRERDRVINLLRSEVQGIYDGKRSTSLSPSPAPFTCMFETRPRREADIDEEDELGEGNLEYTKMGDDDGKRKIKDKRKGNEYMSRSQIDSIANLYLAFKRADVADDERPTTYEIKRTFESDPAVHKIFALETIMVDSSDDFFYSKITERKPDRLNSETEKSSVFGLQNTEKPSLWRRCWSELWHQWRTDADEPQKPMRSIEQNAAEKCWREVKRFVAKLGLYNQETRGGSRRVFTGQSRIKVEAMLKKLRQVETEHVVCLSKRTADNTRVDFQTYSRGFWLFVGSNDWQRLSSDSLEQRAVFDDVQHRLLGPSINERFVRDGFLGSNLSAYEIQLPGRLCFPTTCRMEGPSCALAPRNRGGLPRPAPIKGEKEEQEEVEGVAAVKKTEEKTNQLYNGLLLDFARYRKEERALVSRVTEFQEKNFHSRGTPREPAEEMMKEVKKKVKHPYEETSQPEGNWNARQHEYDENELDSELLTRRDLSVLGTASATDEKKRHLPLGTSYEMKTSPSTELKRRVSFFDPNSMWTDLAARHLQHSSNSIQS